MEGMYYGPVDQPMLRLQLSISSSYHSYSKEIHSFAWTGQPYLQEGTCLVRLS